ncbi:MAG: glycoside hydrolase [Acidobacteriota bacterium]
MSTIRRIAVSVCIGAGLAATAFGLAPVLAQQPASQQVIASLKWRLVGPFRGGRINAVSGVPGQPNIFFYGSVGGGVWKSGNAGRTWKPVFDREPAASIGAIAVAASASNVVYVGTGESDMRDSIGYGNGVYKSVDGGETWKHIGLDDTKQIARVAVDPRNANVVFVAALGHAYGPSPNRGIYRSLDGGTTWKNVLYQNDAVGAADVAIDPSNGKVVYAALWATRRPPWYVYGPSNGPGGGLFKSSDGGTTWRMLASGLPTEGIGRIGLAISPTNPRRIYAIVDAKDGGLYRSEDAGEKWVKVSGDTRIWSRGWYFEKVSVDPRNADTVYVSNTSLYKSTDGGKSWTPIKGAPGGDDYHQLWISPDDSKRMILASDQGAIVTVDGAETWSSWYNQSTAQLYHVAADNRFPYWISGAQQDSGAVAVPSRGPHAVISMHEWTGTCAGGESGYTAPDPLHPEMLYGGTVSRCNLTTGLTENVSPERGAPGGPFRHAWTQPLVFSASNPHKLYFANQYLYHTVNGGESWTRISPDLTRDDPGVPANLDAAAAADAPADKRRGVIYTIAPSPVRDYLVWVGTDDGFIHVTGDDGKTWRNVTPPSLTSWSKVTMMEASHTDELEAYASVERHQLQDDEPYIYRTRDGGKTWQSITRGLPPGVYVQTVKEDPVRRGLLFAGTERGVFVSLNDGDDWQSLQLNLPATSMRDLVVKDDDLIVATHGRGFWILDDIGPLRQLGDGVARADAYLFKPADTIIIPAPSEQGTPLPKDEPFAENPPFGAVLDYYLKAAATGPVTLEIVDAAGQVLRRFSSDDRATPRDPNTLNIPAHWAPTPEPLSAAAGAHRWVWDLRTVSPGASAGRGAGRGAGAGTGGGGGGGGGRGGAPLAQPGTYTAKLTVDGKTYTQPLIVKPDPRLTSR